VTLKPLRGGYRRQPERPPEHTHPRRARAYLLTDRDVRHTADRNTTPPCPPHPPAQRHPTRQPAPAPPAL